MAYRHALCLATAGAALLGAALPGAALAQPPAASSSLTVSSLTARDVPRVALTRNPSIAAARQQRGIAAAGVVLARVHPYNPVLNFTPQIATGGPAGAITAPFTSSNTLTLEVEVRGQRRLRIQAADEALSRTEWEIAALELALAGKAVRAFNAVIYRQEKLKFLEANADLARRALSDLQSARAKKKEDLTSGEKVLLQFEIKEALAQLVAGRGPLTAARHELIQALGVAETPTVRGDLRITERAFAERELQARARDLRPDLQARQAALAEADSKLKLEHAGRFGNPQFGPAYATNETGIHFLGATLVVPIPILNRKQGEILQRRAELAKSAAELRQTEVQADQEIAAALARLIEVQQLIQLYRDDYVPALEQRSAELEKLYRGNDPDVDVQQVLELRRRLLKVRESYLDALYEHGQIEVDLALAVGDLELAFDPE